MRRRAFISVYDKSSIEDFAKNLVAKFNYEIVAAGNTYKLLENAGIEVTDVANLTNAPAILSKEFNALNENILAGILANSSDSEELDELEKFAIKTFDMVIVNFQPFNEIETKTSNIDEIIKKIDIVGVTLIRAAAKNYKNVTVITDKIDYYLALNANDFGRLKLAAKALKVISDYDKSICSTMLNEIGETPYKSFSLEKISELTHGENHNQKASIYKGNVMADYEVEDNKELSYNDILNITEATNIWFGYWLLNPGCQYVQLSVES